MPYPAYGGRPPPSAPTPPSGPFDPSSVSTFNSYNSTAKPNGLNDNYNTRMGMGIARTPSPTPSEAKAMNEPLFSWSQLTNWRFWIRKEWTSACFSLDIFLATKRESPAASLLKSAFAGSLWKELFLCFRRALPPQYYIAGAIIMTITALISIYHHQIVHALTPVTNWLHGLKFGYLVPIGVLFVISFPPLFGHEIVAILCGLVWGLWIGFAIVCAGTFLGEVGNFYAFKWCCRARGEKMERTQIPYACLARCVRVGGFKIALIARFSAIPGHFTTAVFSTCGMNIFVFSIAAILSLPKQFITVYLGVILEQSDNGTTSTKSKIISDSVLAATFLVTILAMWYIFHQMAIQKPLVIYERRKARQGKMQGVNLDLYTNPNDSESSVGYGGEGVDIPLTAKPGSTALDNGIGGSSSTFHPRYDYELQQKQRQAAEWAAQRRQYEEQQRGRPSNNNNSAPYNMYGEQERYNPYSPRNESGQEEHQQWDAQGRAVGYTPADAREFGRGRTPIQANAYTNPVGGQQHVPGEAEVYAHGRTAATAQTVVREGTSDEVGVGYADAGVEESAADAAPQRQQTQHQVEPETPTQAQYATYQPPPSAASTTLAYLKSPFDDPSGGHDLEPSSSTFGGGHGVEPTAASYHTAYGSESDHMDTQADLVPPSQGRAFSPPPPSYRTNAGRYSTDDC
ncbi:hypothetical protein MVEN_02521600 [Mycena venus]|uniref:Golgi apparatus membrane protein TVP38 n=1 Tax=Mycena venus TaxID=2733690 RepID=A0A8H7CAU0_9AGAR|nr:hypothetical protein MVEN_02521600 [Mycena venus]